MSMSDCQKCWDTPCSCGWELRHRSIESLLNEATRIQRAIEFKRKKQKAVFSKSLSEETDDDKMFMKYMRGERVVFYVCPECGGDQAQLINDELKELIQKCVLISEHVGPGGRELVFKYGGQIRLPDVCNACDHVKLLKLLTKAWQEEISFRNAMSCGVLNTPFPRNPLMESMTAPKKESE